MDYSEVYTKALRYGADLDTVHTLGSQLTTDERAGTKHAKFDPSRRLAFADSLRDNGRDEEADHVQNLETPLHFSPNDRMEADTKIAPGVVKYRDAYFHQGIDARELMDTIEEHGPEHALVQSAHDHDRDAGIMYDNPAHNEHDQVHTKGDYTMSWEPDMEYVNLQKRHILPMSAAKHNLMVEPGVTEYHPRYDMDRNEQH